MPQLKEIVTPVSRWCPRKIRRPMLLERCCTLMSARFLSVMGIGYLA